MKQYSTFDIVRILPITRERLKDWMDRKYISPSIQSSTGKGSRNLFSELDLHKIEVIRELSINGIALNLASSVANDWTELSMKNIVRCMGSAAILVMCDVVREVVAHHKIRGGEE
jgi:hypothetical protein